MSEAPRILAFSGSARQESFNKMLVKIAAAGAREAGGEVTVLDFHDLPLPLYDGDLEAERGQPENAAKLRELMLAHNGFLISAPEYNSSITPLLKNAIDWATRTADAKPSLECFQGKTAVVMSASPGPLGGMRGLVHIRAILGNIGTLVLPETKSIRQAYEAFDEDGYLKDAEQQAAVKQLGARLVGVLRKLG